MSEKKPEKKFYFINSFDKNSMWYKLTLLLAFIMLGTICYLIYEYTVITFFTK